LQQAASPQAGLARRRVYGLLQRLSGLSMATREAQTVA
jgi:hypothetical protein